MKIRAFNMVEVMLAVVVIAVGLSSVFVLFPAGLTAHKTATADNSLADLAEFIFSSVKAQIDIESSGEDDTSQKKFKNGYWAGCANTPADAGVDIGDESDWEPIDIFEKSVSDKAKRRKEDSLLQHKTKKNVFWVRQVSGAENNRFADFSAIARVYVDRSSANNTGMGNEFFYGFSDKKMKMYKNISFPSGKESLKDVRAFILPLVLEISYPAELEYDRREKRYFRFEVFNENYEPRE